MVTILQHQHHQQAGDGREMRRRRASRPAAMSALPAISTKLNP